MKTKIRDALLWVIMVALVLIVPIIAYKTQQTITDYFTSDLIERVDRLEQRVEKLEVRTNE